MKKVEIKVNKLKNKLIIDARLNPRKRDEPLYSCDTHDVFKLLNKLEPKINIEEYKIIKKPELPLHNSINKSRLAGAWVLEKVESKTKKAAVKPIAIVDEQKETSELKNKKPVTKVNTKKTKKQSVKSSRTRTSQTTANILKNKKS